MSFESWWLFKFFENFRSQKNILCFPEHEKASDEISEQWRRWRRAYCAAFARE